MRVLLIDEDGSCKQKEVTGELSSDECQAIEQGVLVAVQFKNGDFQQADVELDEDTKDEDEPSYNVTWNTIENAR